MRRRISTVEMEVWRYLWHRFEEAEGAPSMREMAQALNRSVGGCREALVKLEMRGYIELAWTAGGHMAHRGVLRVSAPDDAQARAQIAPGTRLIESA